MEKLPIYLAYAPGDAAIGQRFATDLRLAGAQVNLNDGADANAPQRAEPLLAAHVLIVLLSHEALRSARLRTLTLLYTTTARTDATKQVVPVWLEPLTMEEMWTNLTPYHPISGSTPATFAVEHLLSLTAQQLDLVIPERTQPQIAAPPPATPRQTMPLSGSLGRPLGLISSVLIVVLVGAIILFSRHAASRSQGLVASTTSIPATVVQGLPSSSTVAAGKGGTPTPVTVHPTPTPMMPHSTPTPGPTVVQTTTPQPVVTPLPAIDFGQGFATTASLQLNGSATSNGSAIRLTDGNSSEEGSFFFARPVAVAQFSTHFQFQMTQAVADGMAFVIQTTGPTALAPGGNNLGYGGMGNSIAVKFDLWSPACQCAVSTTGLYTNGAVPDQPDTPLPSTIDFHSGHAMRADITYQAGTLSVMITDTVTGAGATQSYQLDLAGTIGSSQGYFGFTGATGGATAIQDIQNWVVQL